MGRLGQTNVAGSGRRGKRERVCECVRLSSPYIPCDTKALGSGCDNTEY